MTTPKISSSSRARIMATSEYRAQQDLLLHQVEAQIGILQGEQASIANELDDLESLADAIRQSLVIIDGSSHRIEPEQQQLEGGK